MGYRIAAILFLAVLGVSDLKNRTVPVWPVAVFAAIMAVLHVAMHDLAALQLLAGAVPGLIMMALAAASPASIGIGDGMVIAAGGIGTGFSAAFESLVLALLVCAVYSGILLIRRKASRKDCLPFIPFLAAGHALVLAAEMIAA